MICWYCGSFFAPPPPLSFLLPVVQPPRWNFLSLSSLPPPEKFKIAAKHERSPEKKSSNLQAKPSREHLSGVLWHVTLVIVRSDTVQGVFTPILTLRPFASDPIVFT